MLSGWSRWIVVMVVVVGVLGLPMGTVSFWAPYADPYMKPIDRWIRWGSAGPPSPTRRP